MASTNLIGDITTVYVNGPSAVTKTNAIAPGGPIMDYPGVTELVQEKFKEAVVLTAKVVTNTNAADSANLTLLNGIVALLNGTSSPSTHCITDINAVIATGPGTATLAASIAAAGPIMDYQGNLNIIQGRLREAKVLVGKLITNTDSSTDATNLGLLNGITAVLV